MANLPRMRTIEKMLSGENLVLYRKIQETIRLTQQKSLAFNVRASYEDIFPILGYGKHEKSLTPGSGDDKSSLTSVDTDPRNKFWNEEQLSMLRRNNYGFRYKAEEKSDYMRDEPEPNPSRTDRLSTITPPCLNKMSIEEELLAPKEDHQSVGTSHEIDMRLYEELTTEEQKNIYDKICLRLGQESGRRYLLVRGLTSPGEEIQTWATECPPRKPNKSTQRQLSCPEFKAKEPIYICPDKCDSVKKEMATLVDVSPTCTTGTKITSKNWKSNLKQERPKISLHVTVKGESDFSFSYERTKSEGSSCPCGLYQCDCDRVRVKCDVPKPNTGCDLTNKAEVNNFLITCRENLQSKKLQDRRFTSLLIQAAKEANRDTRESVFFQSSYDQTKNELETCLMKAIPPKDREAIEKGHSHVQELTKFFAESKMIDERDWRAWRSTQTKMYNIDNSDEIDSLDSDIVTSGSSDDQISECNLKVPKTLQPSRIPYFKETYQLANVLFDKCNTKINKLIAKNHNWKQLQTDRPVSFSLLERINLLASSGKIFNQITKLNKEHHEYKIKLIPLAERKRRKQVRASKKNAPLRREQRFREYIEGVQLGKRFNKTKRSLLFTKLGNYRGFSPRRQKLLQETGDGKFAKCNLVRKDESGRAPNQKTMHKDYRFIRAMFDDQMNEESLWDPGMLARMGEYFGGLRDAEKADKEDEEDEDTSGISDHLANRKIPKQEEHKTQTAIPSSWSYCSGSSGNSAEALTSMIRSLRWEAESHAAGVSSKPISVSDGDTNPQVCNTKSRGAYRERVGPKSDLGLWNRGKSGPCPGKKSQHRPYTQENTIMKTDFHSIPRSEPMGEFSGRPRSKHTALPPIQSRPPKSSKTVR